MTSSELVGGSVTRFLVARIYLFFAATLAAVVGGWLYGHPSISVFSVVVILTLYASSFLVVFFLFRDPFHPILLGGFGIFLYVAWDPLFSIVLGVELGACDLGALGLGSLALSAFVLTSMVLPQNSWRIGGQLVAGFDSLQWRRPDVLFYTLLIGVFLAIAGAFYFSYTSSAFQKRDIEVPGWSHYVTRFVLAFLVFYTIIVVGNGSRRGIFLCVGLGVLFGGGLLVLLGERNYLLTFLVAFCFSLFLFSQSFGKREIFASVLLILILLPLSQGIKGLVSWGGYGGFSIYQNLSSFHGQEFRAGGRNLSNLVCQLSGGQYPWLHFRDLGRFFYFVDQGSHQFVNHEIGWGGKGRGFSLVGQNWLVGGWFAVVLFYVTAAAVMGVSYRLVRRGPVFAALYVFLALGFVYAQRADFANWLAFFVKTGLIPILVAALLMKVKLTGPPRLRAIQGCSHQ